MRIGLICPYNYFRPGGVQVCIGSIAEELKKRGHYVRIIAPKPKIIPSVVPKELILVGNSTEFNTPFATKADLGMSGSVNKIDELLKEHNFDVLHFHEPGLPLLSAQILSRSKSVNIGTMHATLPEGMVSKSFERLMQPYAKLIEPKLHFVTAVSETAKETALTYSPKTKVEIVPNGIDIDVFKTKTKTRSEKDSKTKTILYIGRLEKRKGVRYLIKAYAELVKDHKNIKLVIAGDGNLRKGLENLVEKYELKNVKFVGFISEKQKIKYLQTADLFVSPALYGESFGIVLLEAMSAGTVVVAGNNPGYQSVMTGRGRLSLVDSKSRTDFAQRMELMLFDYEIRNLWLKWANNYIKQFDYSLITDKYEKIYKDTIKKYKA